MDTLQETMKRLFQSIEAGDGKALLPLFENGAADVQLPYFGHITNNTIFVMLIKKIQKWLAKKQASVQFVDWTQGEQACVAEFDMTYAFHDKEREQMLTYHTPIGLVCDLQGTKIKALRAYYGTVYIAGKEIVRPAIWNEDPALGQSLMEPVKSFFAALDAKEPEKLSAVFADEAVIYHHIEKAAYQGKAEILEFYGRRGYDTVQLCNKVEDASHCCVECTALRRGPDIVTPQAELMVFCCAAGKIQALRIYNETVLDFKMWHTLY